MLANCDLLELVDGSVVEEVVGNVRHVSLHEQVARVPGNEVL